MTEVNRVARRQAAARKRIVEEAIGLFETRGIDGVTVDEIASLADVAKGTIYNHFAAKEDIVVSFLIEIDRAALGDLPRIAQSAPTAADALFEASWSLLANKEQHYPLVRIFLARLFAASASAGDLTAFQAALDEALGRFFDVLTAGDDVPGVAPREDFVRTFKTLQFGLTAVWAMEGAPWALTRRQARIEMNLLAKGLDACPSSSIWPPFS